MAPPCQVSPPPQCRVPLRPPSTSVRASRMRSRWGSAIHGLDGVADALVHDGDDPRLCRPARRRHEWTRAQAGMCHGPAEKGIAAGADLEALAVLHAASAATAADELGALDLVRLGAVLQDVEIEELRCRPARDAEEPWRPLEELAPD